MNNEAEKFIILKESIRMMGSQRSDIEKEKLINDGKMMELMK